MKKDFTNIRQRLSEAQSVVYFYSMGPGKEKCEVNVI